MKKNAFIKTAVLALALLLLLTACVEGGEGVASQATPTAIDEVRYNFNILYDDMNEIADVLREVGYDYENDTVGFNGVYVELLEIGQVMPTMDDVVTVSELEALDLRVKTAAANVAALKTRAYALKENG